MESFLVSDLGIPLLPLRSQTNSLPSKSAIKLMSATNNTNQSNLNLVVALQAAQDISRELNVNKLVNLSLSVLIELSEAQSGAVILANGEEFIIAATSLARSQNLEMAQRSTWIDDEAASLAMVPRNE